MAPDLVGLLNLPDDQGVWEISTLLAAQRASQARARQSRGIQRPAARHRAPRPETAHPVTLFHTLTEGHPLNLIHRHRTLPRGEAVG